MADGRDLLRPAPAGRSSKDLVRATHRSAPKSTVGGSVLGGIGDFFSDLAGETKAAVLGFPAGMVMLATDPGKFGKAFWHVYAPLFEGDIAEYYRRAGKLGVALDFGFGAATVLSRGGALATVGAPLAAVRASSAIAKTGRVARAAELAKPVAKAAVLGRTTGPIRRLELPLPSGAVVPGRTLPANWGRAKRIEAVSKTLNRLPPQTPLLGVLQRAARQDRRAVQAEKLALELNRTFATYLKAFGRLDKRERAALHLLGQLPLRVDLERRVAKAASPDEDAIARAAADPKVASLYEQPTAKMKEALAASEQLGELQARLLGLPEEVTRQRRYLPILLTRGASFVPEKAYVRLRDGEVATIVKQDESAGKYTVEVLREGGGKVEREIAPSEIEDLIPPERVSSEIPWPHNQDVSKELVAPQRQVLYHVAPKSKREQILREGLRAPDARDIAGKTLGPGDVHFWNSLEDASEWAKGRKGGRGGQDIWRVDASGLPTKTDRFGSAPIRLLPSGVRGQLEDFSPLTIKEMIAAVEGELSQAGRPFPVYFPHKSVQQPGEGRVGGGFGRTPPARTAASRQSEGVLFLLGQLALDPDLLGAGFLSTIRHLTYEKAHELLLARSTPIPVGQGLPVSHEWVRTKRGQRIPHTETTKGVFRENLDDLFPPDETLALTSRLEADAFSRLTLPTEEALATEPWKRYLPVVIDRADPSNVRVGALGGTHADILGGDPRWIQATAVIENGQIARVNYGWVGDEGPPHIRPLTRPDETSGPTLEAVRSYIETMADLDGGARVRYAVPSAYAKIVAGEFIKTSGVIRKFIYRPLDVWRSLVLNLRIGWLTNNVVGNHLLLITKMHGLKGVRAYLGMIASTKGAGAARRLLRLPENRRWLTNEDLLDLAQTAGGRELAATVGGTFIETQTPAGKVSKWARRAGLGIAGVEKMTERGLRRAKVGEAVLRSPEVRARYRAMPKETRNFREAAKQELAENADLTRQVVDEVSEALGDFLSLNRAERDWVRGLVPFYAWYKAIGQITLKMPLDHPGRTALLAKIGQIGEEWSEAELGPLFSHLRGAVPLGGDTLWKTQAANPWATTIQTGEALGSLALPGMPSYAARAALGQLNPFATGIGQALYRAAEGRTQFGAIPDALLEIAAGLPFARIADPNLRYRLQGRQPPKPSEQLYRDRGRLEEGLQYLGVGIRDLNRREARKRAKEGR